MVELRPHDAKVLLLAVLTAAMGLCALALRFDSGPFQPWPATLFVLFAAGMAGAFSFWAAGGTAYGFPLVLLLFPPLRLLLLYLRHGAPPWPLDLRRLLLGDDFPWWAGASFLVSLYAGMLTGCWARATLSLEKLRERPAYGRMILAETARLAAAEAVRLYLGGLLLAAFALSLAGGEGEGIPAMLCTLAFLLAGFAFTGSMQARSMTAVWHAEGVEIAEGCEERWWSGHWHWLLPLLLLPLFPLGLHSFRLGDVLLFLTNFLLRPGWKPKSANTLPKNLLQRVPALQLPSPLVKMLLGFLSLLYLLMFGLAVCGAAIVCLLLLWRLFRLVRGWFSGLGPLLRTVRGFLAALLSLFRRTVAARIASRRIFFGRFPPRRAALRRSRGVWPPTAIRRLFARLVLWGRSQGIALPSALAPAEIARELSALAPEGGEEDLAFLVEVYRRERYGEERVDRRTRLLYRRAWKRIARSKTVDATPPEGGGT